MYVHVCTYVRTYMDGRRGRQSMQLVLILTFESCPVIKPGEFNLCLIRHREL